MLYIYGMYYIYYVLYLINSSKWMHNVLPIYIYVSMKYILTYLKLGGRLSQ